MTVAPLIEDPGFTLYIGDAKEVLAGLPDESVHCVVTSPPYWRLRDYGYEAQLGMEATPDDYVARLVDVFRQVSRILRRDGTCWLNLGDSYARPEAKGQRGASVKQDSNRGTPQIMATRPPGLPEKNLIGIPWRVALALQADGWYLRSDIVWEKPDAMPDSVQDRPTHSHEYVFLLTRSARYFYDVDAIREPHSPDGRNVTTRTERDGSHANYQEFGHEAGRERWPNGGRNARTVWQITTTSYPGAHYAVFPEALPRRCIAAGCPPGGVVLDPFIGTGTTALAARKLGRRCIGIELSPEHAASAAARLGQQTLLAPGG